MGFFSSVLLGGGGIAVDDIAGGVFGKMPDQGYVSASSLVVETGGKLRLRLKVGS
jgi:hypothetical protein